MAMKCLVCSLGCFLTTHGRAGRIMSLFVGYRRHQTLWKMTEWEKVDAALYQLANPPRCHCGVSAILITPSQWNAFTPLYHCGLLDYVSVLMKWIYFDRCYWCAHYNISLATFSFRREGSRLVTSRSTTMDPNRIGLLSINLRSFKQASSHGHAQRCLTISASVVSRLTKELFRSS
jgi:hypothetical protein